MVPVTNLFQRLAWKGVERQHQAIDPANRYGGLPSEKHDVYKDRSPLYSVDKLQIPLYVGVTRNDEDVNIEEDMQLVDALARAQAVPGRRRRSTTTRPAGHTFDRRVDPKTWQPENTREQRDSWNRVWTFLDWQLDPFHDAATPADRSLRRHEIAATAQLTQPFSMGVTCLDVPRRSCLDRVPHRWQRCSQWRLAARRSRPARAAGRHRRHDLQSHRRPADAPKSS